MPIIKEPHTTLTNPIAVQTIVYGESFESLPDSLEQLAGLGFDGVEFYQVPALLSETLPKLCELEFSSGNPTYVEAQLALRDLRLVGLSGGSIRSRVEFARGLTVPPEYLYFDSAPDTQPGFQEALMEPGVVLAFHPYLFKSGFSIEDIEKNLARDPSIRLIPDTAHFKCAGADIMSILNHFQERIIALHLKDWTRRYGWSRAGYSRGFLPLGLGEIDFAPILSWLAEHPTVWAVIEQDFSHRLDPFEDLEHSISVLGRKPRRDSHRVPVSQGPSQQQLTEPSYASALAKCAVYTSKQLYTTVCQFANALFGAKCANLWEVQTPGSQLVMVGFAPYDKDFISVENLNIDGSQTGRASIERIPICTRGIKDMAERGEFRDKILVDRFDIDSMISLPIGNAFNRNSIELVLNLFYSNDPPEIPFTRTLEFLEAAAFAFDVSWNDIRLEALQEMAYDSFSFERLSQCLANYLPVIRRRLSCREVCVYLVDIPPARMVLRGAQKEDINMANVEPQEYEKTDESLVSRAWRERQVINIVPSLEAPALILSPIYKLSERGEVIGIVKCKGKSRDNLGKRHFDITDEVALDALQAGLSPHLERSLMSDERAFSFKIIRHEMKGVVGQIRTAAVDALKEIDPEYEDRVYGPNPYGPVKPASGDGTSKPTKLLEHLFEDIANQADTIESIITRRSYMNPVKADEIQKRRVRLGVEVIGPIIHKLQRSGELSDADVSYRELEGISALFVDLSKINQVFLNLLDNAIKYREANARLKIRVRGSQRLGGAMEIYMEDWGIGVSPGQEKLIFRPSYREKKAREKIVIGEGLGLWYVQQILEAHGARIELTNNKKPTRFTLYFPATFQYIPNIQGL